MEILYTLFIGLCIGLAAALPLEETAEQSATTVGSFASDASKLIAISMLKSNIDIDGNQVHSPLGVSSILAVLAEAADGETFDEFNKVFGYPKERDGLRASYKHILGKYQHSKYSTEPSFQTWLYIYHNYSARDDFKQLVRDNYYVEVKDINRNEYDWSEPNTSLDLHSTTASNSKDVVGFETLKRIKVDDDDADDKTVASVCDATTAKRDTYGEEIINKEASKFDRFVDDKQYVEKPVILEEIKREQEKKKETISDDGKQSEAIDNADVTATENVQKLADNLPANSDKETIITVLTNLDDKEMTKRHDEMEENETVQNIEKMRKQEETADNTIVPIQDVLESNEPQKISLPLQKLENAIEAAAKASDGEIMLALESHIRAVRRVYGARSLFHKDDITTALSANSVTGREVGSKTKMLLFNGLYYRGNWATPFVQPPGDDDEHFFMTSEDAMKAPMMHAKGKFKTANLEHLNAKFLCLHYENKKYSMMVILPNDIEGLHGVIEKFQTSDLQFAKQHAEEKELHVTMPKFQAEETSRSESMLKSLGLQKLFSRTEADLSRLSEDKDLHIDEIVQFVSVRVDEGGSSENALSASSPQVRSSEENLEMFEINHPFLYFVMDCEEDFVIASGKVYSPELIDDLPVSIEVEYQQS